MASAKTVSKVFSPNPGPQAAFWNCQARIIGYGGAMGGGKSRAICEKALEYALKNPGVQILIARQKHTSIVETTRKTFFEEVCPPELIARGAGGRQSIKRSNGEDFVDLVTGVPGVTSRINFIGLEDPVRWFSAQIGVLIVDQVEECDEDTIVKLMTRLRDPKAPMGRYDGKLGIPYADLGKARADGFLDGEPDMTDFPDPAPTTLIPALVKGYPLQGKVILSFNPENPGHWLMHWFFEGIQMTPSGTKKAELYATGADFPFGDAEFFFAKATDNPHLAAGYVAAQLAGMPEHLRRRYLDGIWEFVSGKCYFDTDALGYYQKLAESTPPVLQGHTVGDCIADRDARLRSRLSDDPVKLKSGSGPWMVWQRPEKDKRYVVSVDVSSGGSTDYSGIQVVCVETLEQCAEYQGKTDPDLVGQEAYRIGRVYNNALIVPEVTGGWGFSVEQELKRLRYPNLYTKKILDRLSRQWTDRTGWDTTVKTRAHMLDTLERLIREKEIGIYSIRLVPELGTFIRDDAGRPAAQPGCNDDLVVSMAIAATVAVDMPRQLRKLKPDHHRPAVSSVTGY